MVWEIFGIFGIFGPARACEHRWSKSSSESSESLDLLRDLSNDCLRAPAGLGSLVIDEAFYDPVTDMLKYLSKAKESGDPNTCPCPNTIARLWKHENVGLGGGRPSFLGSPRLGWLVFLDPCCIPATWPWEYRFLLSCIYDSRVRVVAMRPKAFTPMKQCNQNVRHHWIYKNQGFLRGG